MHGCLAARAPGWKSLDQELAYSGDRMRGQKFRRSSAAVAKSREGRLRLRGFTNQLVVHLDQEVVGLRIEPRHGRTKRACDPVYGAMD
jgi:hypothetical protein